MAKSFLNIHFYAKNIKKIFKNGVKCKKSGNFGLLNQEFGFSKVYYIYSFYFIKNRSAEKSLLNRESLLYLRLLNQESTVIPSFFPLLDPWFRAFSICCCFTTCVVNVICSKDCIWLALGQTRKKIKIRLKIV